MYIRKIIYLITAIFILGLTSIVGLHHSASTNSHAINSDTEFKTYIVEMEDPSVIHSLKELESLLNLEVENISNLKVSLLNSHKKTLLSAKEKGIKYNKLQNYTLTFNGFAVETSESTIDQFASLPGVEAVYPDKQIQLELEESLTPIGAKDVWDMPNDDSNKTTGKGINVAVIDTGIDYTHPDLGGEFGPGSKVVSGYDFVNNNDDPMDNHGHGTHVAGIISANGELKGVAPEANLIAYKVFNDQGAGSTSDIIAAIEEAINPENPYRADVINMSLGGSGDGSDPLAIAAENAVKSGVSVVTSAGNQGPGYQTISSPGGAEGVITVGASISGVSIPKISLLSPIEEVVETYRLEFSANPPETKIESELIDVGEGLPEDYKEIDVEGKTLLIQSSTPDSYMEKATYAEEMGAEAVIFYLNFPWSPWTMQPEGFFNNSYKHELNNKNNKQHRFNTGIESFGRFNSLVAVEIDDSTANLLKEYMNEEEIIKIEIDSEDATDQIPAFSSRGHAPNYNLSPNIVAPGVEIVSTMPSSLYESGYARLSGTSMAAPHVAGSVALMLQLKPEWDNNDINNALVGTAATLEDYDSLTQGAGRLDVKAAADSNITASPSSISFGIANFDGDRIEENTEITLENHGENTIELDLSVENDESEGHVEIEPSKIQLQPGQQMDVELNLSHEHPEQYKDIMGWVNVTVQGDNPDLRIPYYLAARPLLLYTSPDPAVGATETFIYSPLESIEPPSVTVETPNGEIEENVAEFDHGNWWKVPMDVGEQGLYTVSASTVTDEANPIVLKGFTHFEGEITKTGNNGASNWQAIGPNAGGGAITLDPKDEDKMYVSRGSAGFFITENDMDTWKERRNLPIAGGTVGELVIDPNDTNKMYAAVNSGFEDPTYRGKLMMSKDAGMTWTTLPFPNTEIRDFMMDQSGNLMVAVTNNQILVSNNRGEVWESLDGPWNTYYDSMLIDGDLYIGTESGLYVVRNIIDGSTTVEITFESPSYYPWVQNIVGNEDIILATTYFDGLYASYDNGQNWFQLFNPSERVQFLRIEDNRIFAGTLRELWVTDNYGETWELWDTPVTGTPVTNINEPIKGHPVYGKPTFVTASNAGVFKTSDEGQSYNRVGVPGANVYDLALTGEGKSLSILAGTQYDTYRKELPNHESIDASLLEWGMSGKEGTVGSTVYFIETSPINSEIVYKVRMGMLDTFFLEKSENGGKTWNTEMSAVGAPQALFIHPANPEQMIIPYQTTLSQGVIKTNDGGETWEDISMDRTILTISGDPTNPERFWTGSGDGLYMTEDRGETFEKLQDVPISTLKVNPNNPDHIIFGGRDFYYSYDGGINIEKGEYNDLSIFIQDIVISPGSSNTLYAATSAFAENDLLKGGRGVLRSQDGGESWHSFSEGLNNKNTTSLVVTPESEHLYVGTIGGSVYRIKLNREN